MSCRRAPRCADAGEIDCATRKPARWTLGPASHITPVSRRKTPRCADAGGIDREVDERVLLPRPAPRAISPVARPEPRATQEPARSTSGPASAPHLSGNAPQNPALRGRRRDRPRGRRARPGPRVVSPVAHPEPRATRKPARSTSGPTSAPHPQCRAAEPCAAGGIDRETDARARPAPRVVAAPAGRALTSSVPADVPCRCRRVGGGTTVTRGRFCSLRVAVAPARSGALTLEGAGAPEGWFAERRRRCAGEEGGEVV